MLERVCPLDTDAKCFRKIIKTTQMQVNVILMLKNSVWLYFGIDLVNKHVC